MEELEEMDLCTQVHTHAHCEWTYMYKYMRTNTHTHILVQLFSLNLSITKFILLISKKYILTIYSTTLHSMHTVQQLKNMSTTLCGPALALQNFCKQMRATSSASLAAHWDVIEDGISLQGCQSGSF